MPVDHRVHRIAQPVRVQRTAQRDIQLHRIQIVVAALRGAGVKEQPLLQRGQRQHVSDLGIAAAARRSAAGSAGQARYPTGVNPPPPPRTCAQIPARASNHNRLSRLTCARSSAEGAHVQLACRCGPASVSTVPALSSTVCASGIGTAAAAPVERQAFRAEPPQLIGQLGRRAAQPPQIVKPDHRVRPGQVHLGVQIAQHTVGQADRAGPEAALWRP